MKYLLRIFVLLLLFIFTPICVFADMSSANYKIQWDTVSDGGSDLATSTNYSVRDTVGLQAIGDSSSTNYQIKSGYRVQESADTLSLVIRTQEASVKTAYTGFNTLGNNVTVSSAASFSVGDYICVIENEGFLENVAVGRITNIAGTVITVDRFDGDQASMSAIPAGGDDFVYRMNGTSAGFGSIAVGAPNVSVTLSSVQSSVQSGYSVYMQADHALRNASAQAITNVSDGTVSLGSEEYGFSTTGTTALLTGSDIAIPTAQTAVQTRANITGSPADRTAMIYKLSVTTSTNPGTYSQSVFYTLTANY